jgi:hypothetical protein
LFKGLDKMNSMLLDAKQAQGKTAVLKDSTSLRFIGGSGEIRTHEGRKPLTVFKTVAFNHSATLPS